MNSQIWACVFSKTSEAKKGSLACPFANSIETHALEGKTMKNSEELIFLIFKSLLHLPKLLCKDVEQSPVYLAFERA